MNEAFYISSILKEIEIKFDYGCYEKWTDAEFKILSESIFEKTAISISPHTLKRLFGKVKYKEEYNPQQATKDALAKFLDFENWCTYLKVQKSKQVIQTETSNPQLIIVNENLKDNKETIPCVNNRKRYKRKLLPLGILFIVIVLVIILIVASKNKGQIKKVSFVANTTTGIAPLTINFKYNADTNDSLYVDFGYTNPQLKYQITHLDRNKKQIYHCFQIPGVYNVYLKTQKEILAKECIVVQSTQWICFYHCEGNYLNSKLLSEYSSNTSLYRFWLDNQLVDTIHDGFLYLPPNSFKIFGIQPKQIFYLEYRYIKRFHIDCDNFSYEIKFKNTEQMGGITCYDSRFAILGKNTNILVGLVEEGCQSWATLRISEKIFKGEYDDLSKISGKLNNWNILKVQVCEKKIIILLNEKEIYKGEYKESLQSINGLSCNFKGSGCVDYIMLTDNHQKIIYREDFN